MSHERQQGLLPPIVDPAEFLDQPFKQYEVGRLASPPDKPLLQWLTTLANETGLVLQHPTWFLIKGSEMGIPSWMMPNNSDTLLHSHPVDPDEDAHDGSIPSDRDFFNCSSTARNLIASFHGITQYWRVEDPYHRRQLESAIYNGRFGPDSKKKYLKFLKDIDAKYHVYPWDELDDKKLNILLGIQDK